MAVPVQAGENTIVFTYATPGLKMGAVISLCGIVLLGGDLWICRIYRKKHPFPSVPTHSATGG
jgi:uncharacterized membrane protein YfhO